MFQVIAVVSKGMKVIISFKIQKTRHTQSVSMREKVLPHNGLQTRSNGFLVYVFWEKSFI